MSELQSKIKFARKNPAVLWTLAGLIICFLTLSFAALSERIIYREGSEVFYILLVTGGFFTHGWFRFSDLILEIPPLIVHWVTSGSSHWLFYVVGGLSYYLHPFVSLVLTYHLMDEDDFKDLWFYPILGFALGVFPGLGFGVNHIAIGVSAFWPALILILSRKSNLARNFLYFALVGLMTFSHESVVLLPLALIAAIFVFRRKNWLFFLLPALACVLWNLFLWQNLSLWESRDFIKAERVNALEIGIQGILLNGSSYFLYSFTICTLLALFASTWWRPIRTYKKLFLNLVQWTSLFFLVYFCTQENFTARLLHYSYSFRVLISPVVAGLAILMLFQKEMKGRSTFPEQKFGIAIFSVLLVLSLQDLRSTFEWKKLSTNLLERLDQMTASCESLSKEEISKIYPNYDPAIVLTSLLIQHSSRPAKILGTKSVLSSGPTDFCQNIRVGHLHYGGFVEKGMDTEFVKFDLLRHP